MIYQIDGTVMQTLSLHLKPDEVIFSQTHALAWMNDQIRMDTHTGGSLMAGLMRGLSGRSIFVTDFTPERLCEIAFAPRFPRTIIARTLAAGGSPIFRPETFLCAEQT